MTAGDLRHFLELGLVELHRHIMYIGFPYGSSRGVSEFGSCTGTGAMPFVPAPIA